MSIAGKTSHHRQLRVALSCRIRAQQPEISNFWLFRDLGPQTGLTRRAPFLTPPECFSWRVRTVAGCRRKVASLLRQTLAELRYGENVVLQQNGAGRHGQRKSCLSARGTLARTSQGFTSNHANASARRPAAERRTGIASQQPLLIAPLAPLASLRLVDIPEHRRRRTVEHAGERLLPRAQPEILSERDVDNLVIGLLLDVGGDLLLFVR